MPQSIDVKWVKTHYVVKANGKFVCSCDDFKEVREELRNLTTNK